MKIIATTIFWSVEDKGFIAEVPDLPGCCAWGETEAEAVREAQDAIAAWLQAARVAKRAIPRSSVVAHGSKLQRQVNMEPAAGRLRAFGRS